MEEKNHSKVKFVLLLLLVFLCENMFFLTNTETPIEKQSSISEPNTVEKDFHTPTLPISSATFDWVLIPKVNRQFFSPDTGDNMLYSFAVNQAENYTLNISAYYNPIENYIGKALGETNYGAAYLMPNGTWLIIGLEYNLTPFELWIVLGIGTDSSNFVWNRVGKVNYTNTMAVAGGEGKIRIVYFEDTTFNKGINYFASNNWGNSWTNGTIMNYTAYPETNIFEISIAEFNGNFTYAWGASLKADISNQKFDLKNCTIVAAEEINDVWSAAFNLTNLGGLLVPRLGCRCPQLFYNRTNNNGTLMLCYDYYLNSSVDATQRVSLLQLGNGINDIATANWSISFERNTIDGYEHPLVYCAKDYSNSTEMFYFLDTTPEQRVGEGIRNVTWNLDVLSQPIDYFQTESHRNLNLYANNGSKCFSMWVRTAEGFRLPGILDCKTPFNIRKYKSSIQPYDTNSYVFDGRDLNGNSRDARAYSFNIFVGSDYRGLNDLIVYVDDVAPYISCSPTTNLISPFSSTGIKDSMTINVQSSEPGVATLNIETVQPVYGQTDVNKDLTYAIFCTLCGDRVNNFLFFTNMEDPINKLMYVKSTDGGLSWTEPKLIVSSLTSGYGALAAAFTGSVLYLWTDNMYLFISTDLGETWIKQTQEKRVNSVTSDLVCWNYYAGSTNQIVLNRSYDFGYTWESFLTIDIVNSNQYFFNDIAFDPISGNYSFILTNDKNVYFITAINNGTKFTFSSNIIVDGNQGAEGYNEMVNIDVLWINENSTEWIITSNAVNEISMTDFTSVLAYTVTDGNLTFSPWQTFLDANGGSLPTSIVPFGTWDILFPENGQPCHVTGVSETVIFPKSFRITSSSNLIYSISKELDEYYQTGLSFNGITGNGQALFLTQNLTWTIEVTDQAGYKVTDSGILYIDNSDPWLSSSSDVIPSKPNLSNDIEISIEVYEKNPSSAEIRYRTPDMTGFLPIMMVMNDSNAPYLIFTGTIQGQDNSVSSLIWYISISDLCGNSLVIDDNGNYFVYERPDIRIQEQEEPPTKIDLNEVESFTVSYNIPEYVDYVSYVYIEYEYDDGEGVQQKNLEATGSLFQYTFEDIPVEATVLTYTIVAVDIYGNEIEFGKERTVNILPKLPSFKMNAGQQVALSFIALSVGVVCGLLFTAVMSTKRTDRTLREEVFRISKLGSKEIPSSRAKEKPIEGPAVDMGKLKKITSLILTGIGFVTCAGFAILYMLFFQSPEISMLFFVGAFVFAITLWVLLSAHTADKILRSTEDLSMHRAKLLLFVVSILIYVSLLAVFFVGNSIVWWRVRVNQQSYNVAGITIPKALTSVTTAFLSSILLLTMSTFKQISNRSEELTQALINNDNPLAVIDRRERAVSTVVNAVAKKGVIFTVIIGVVIIFASDLNLYANQAIIMAIPFVIGAFASLILATYFKRKKELTTEAEALLLDHIISCPECKTETAVGSKYCENCGKELLRGPRFSKGVRCSICKKVNPQGIKHCRYCGATLESNETFKMSGDPKINK